MLYDLLRDLIDVPTPFAVGGPRQLWSDPHVQRQMLAYHLDPDVDAASRSHAFVARSIGWITAALGIGEGTRVLDLGCGPGLYANPLAEQGAHVHGIDLSPVAIAAARQRSATDRTSFEVGDYLTARLPDHDLALLIYCDYGAMSPPDRLRLLERVRARIADGGRLLVDLHSEHRFRQLEAGCRVEDRLMDGFWAPGPYVGIHQTVLYDPDRVALDRYVIVEPGRTRSVHSWAAHLSLAQATAEFARAGFRVTQVLDDVAGAAYEPTGAEYALVATPGPAGG